MLARALGPTPDPEVDAAFTRERERRERERERKERSGLLGEIRERDKTLRGFTKNHWKTLEPEQHLEYGWALEAIDDHLAAVTAGHIKRLLLNVPPGFMKSLKTGVFWPAWEWGPQARPSLRYLGAAYKEEHAARDTEKMRNLVQSDLYQDLYGDLVTVTKSRADHFENSRTGWRKGRPIKSLTGDRGDRVFIDDPHSVEMAESMTERAATLRKMRETVPTRLNDPKKSAIVVIMQRLHETDVSGMIIAEDLGYTHLCLPMRFDASRRCSTAWHGHRFTDPRTYDGELLFPERFDAESVDRTEHEMTEYAVAGQMQQRPVPREGGMFKQSWFEVVDAVPAGGAVGRAWDLAATAKKIQKQDPDWTVGLKGVKAPNGIFYITGMERFREDPGIVEARIKNTASGDGRAASVSVPQDPGAGGKTLAATLVRMLAGYPVHVASTTGDKVTRATPAAAQAKHGNIKIARGPWNDDFFAEVCTFPMARHDDIVDALSDLIDMLSTKSIYSLDGID